MNRLEPWLLSIVLAGCSASSEEAALQQAKATFEALENKKVHAAIDSKTLGSIADAEVEFALIDLIYERQAAWRDDEEAFLAAQPPGRRALYLTWVVEAEVNNGGFNQYYYNTDGKFAAQAVEAFEYFGATRHAALMKEANSVREAEKAEMAKFKDAGTLEAFSESYEHSKLGPLDDRFYAVGEDLSRLRVARIRRTPAEFADP